MKPLIAQLLALLSLNIAHAQSVPSNSETGDQNKVVIAETYKRASYKYSDLYKTLEKLEKYKKEKNLINIVFEVLPKSDDVLISEAKIKLIWRTGELNFESNAMGRIIIPRIPTAYDENAVIEVNRHKESIRFHHFVTIKPKADNAYSSEYLTTACEQVRKFLIFANAPWRENNYKMKASKCIGARFVSLDHPTKTPKLHVLKEQEIHSHPALLSENSKDEFDRIVASTVVLTGQLKEGETVIADSDRYTIMLVVQDISDDVK